MVFSIWLPLTTSRGFMARIRWHNCVFRSLLHYSRELTEFDLMVLLIFCENDAEVDIISNLPTSFGPTID